MAARHLHILGVCGTFMGGVAALAKAAGFRVTGCDSNVYPPMSDQLRSLGIELVEGYAADQRSLRPDLWVVGNVVSRGNPLMEAILDHGEPFMSGPQWLSENVLRGKWVLAVAGTHGKTTTSALLAWILDAAGKRPGFLIGGVPQNFPTSARLTDADHFVIEADEYDTAFFDKRSKFVHYRPRTLILNNLEYDHADIFADLAAIERQFHHLIRIVPGNGRIIANGTDAALSRVLKQGVWTPVDRFGVAEGWFAGPAVANGEFDVSAAGQMLGRVSSELQGEHGRLNALAAIAAAAHAGVDPKQALVAISAFRGVRRRMELRGTARGVNVFDDFAHHPTAIRTTVAGLRAKVGSARILAVLEPRSNTMKLGVMNQALPASLEQADCVFVFGAGLGWDPHKVFGPQSARARCFTDMESLIEAIALEARAGDQVLLMSNGGFGGIHDRLLTRLAGTRKADA